MLEALKERVIAVAQAALAEGLVHEGGGNYSCYDPENKYVVITPRGTPGLVLKVGDIPVVDLDGKVIEGTMRPSSEIPMHTGIYRNCPNVGGIVYDHGPYGSVFAAMNKQVPTNLLNWSGQFGAFVPVVPFAVPGTAGMCDACLPYLKDHTGLLLKNQGQLTVGSTVEQALNRAIYLEELCRIYWMILCIGQPEGITQEQFAAIRARRAAGRPAPR